MHTESKEKKDKKEGYYSTIIQDSTIKEVEADLEVTEEDDLEKEEVQLYVITTISLGTWSDTIQTHIQHALIVEK